MVRQLSAAYRPREPEQTALYRIVERYLPDFVHATDDAERSIPPFVLAELEGFLRCGRLQFGFARQACEGCDFERLIGLPCGGRGFCPSCLGRRMVQSAAQWVDFIFPTVPVRQWVCSLPFELRLMLAYDRALCSSTLRCVVHEILRWLKRTAKRELGLASVADAHPGGLTVIQRAGGALNLNPHFHTALFDGAYVRDGADGFRFHALPAPKPSDLEAVNEAIVERIQGMLQRRGLNVLEDEASSIDAAHLVQQMPLLGECAGASMQGVELLGARVGQRQGVLGVASPLHLGIPADLKHRSRTGVDLHAGVRVGAHDKKRLERLFQYLLRPPLSYDRVELLESERVRLRLKSPWRNGATHLEMEPLSFLGRLVALVPPRGMHLVRFHGALGARSKVRRSIIPPRPRLVSSSPPVQLGFFEDEAGAEHRGPGCCASRAVPESLPEPSATSDDAAAPRGAASTSAQDARDEPAPLPRETPQRLPKLQRMTWARLLKRMAGYDMDTCPECGRSLRVREVVLKAEAIAAALVAVDRRRLLAPSTTARGPPGASQLLLRFEPRQTV